MPTLFILSHAPHLDPTEAKKITFAAEGDCVLLIEDGVYAAAPVPTQAAKAMEEAVARRRARGSRLRTAAGSGRARGEDRVGDRGLPRIRGPDRGVRSVGALRRRQSLNDWPHPGGRSAPDEREGLKRTASAFLTAAGPAVSPQASPIPAEREQPCPVPERAGSPRWPASPRWRW